MNTNRKIASQMQSTTFVASIFKNRQDIIWFALICLFWVILRLNGIADFGDAEWEKNVALKLIEYGWSATNGGILEWHFMFGHIDKPVNYLYVNHPPGMIWLYALFIKTFGAKFIRVIPILLNLMGLISLFYLTKKHFDKNTAIYSALIISFLPGTLFLDSALNIIILSTSFWILIAIITMHWYESNNQNVIYILLITVVFATQVDWVSFFLFPSIL